MLLLVPVEPPAGMFGTAATVPNKNKNFSAHVLKKLVSLISETHFYIRTLH